MLGDQKQDWLAARLEDLDDGDIDGICAAVRAYPLVGAKKDKLDKALRYFENRLELPLGTVKTRAFHAMRALRAALARQGFDPTA